MATNAHPNSIAGRLKPEAIRLSKDWDAARQRRAQIVLLRNNGMSFAEIGRQFDISKGRACQIYHMAQRNARAP